MKIEDVKFRSILFKKHSGWLSSSVDIKKYEFYNGFLIEGIELIFYSENK